MPEHRPDAKFAQAGRPGWRTVAARYPREAVSSLKAGVAGEGRLPANVT
jgi:hypothetical protein